MQPKRNHNGGHWVCELRDLRNQQDTDLGKAGVNEEIKEAAKNLVSHWDSKIKVPKVKVKNFLESRQSY